MTAKPELETQNAEYVNDGAERLRKEAPERPPCSEGERRAADFLLNELKPWSDETTEEVVFAHPAAGPVIYKAVCIMLILSAVLFKISEINGTPALAAVASPLSLAAFALFAHKFFFDGTAVDKLFPKKRSQNIIFKRYPRAQTLTRVVITADLDTPQYTRAFGRGKNTAYLLTVCCIFCNTLIFCCCNAFLLCGAPENSTVFSVLSTLCVLLSVFYIAALLLYKIKPSKNRCDRGADVCLTLAAIMKQLSERGFRYANTELCIMFTGCGSASHAGAYTFAEKHRRTYRDIPTVFISLEDISDTFELALYFKDTDSGSSEAASILAEAAESIDLKAEKEASLFGTPAHIPFTSRRFAACSAGSSKKHGDIPDGKSFSENAAFDLAYILTQAVNYYDNLQR